MILLKVVRSWRKKKRRKKATKVSHGGIFLVSGCYFKSGGSLVPRPRLNEGWRTNQNAYTCWSRGKNRSPEKNTRKLWLAELYGLLWFSSSCNTRLQQSRRCTCDTANFPWPSLSFQLQTPPIIVNIFIITWLLLTSQVRKPKILGEVCQTLILREGGVWELD